MPSSKDPYDDRASSFADRWESVTFELVHRSWMHVLPANGGLALDVGAGSGRDAAWLAENGFEVVAVEPSIGLREAARQRHTSARIHWVADSMPSLAAVHRLDYRYDLILLSAVWMHVRPKQRERAFRKLSELLKPGGLLIFTLKHGPADPEREMHAVDASELEHLARRRALLPVALPQDVSPDVLGRDDVYWTAVALRLPDDGTGALPLLRHVIVNDAKSATHKLALLRVLVRIADGARGMVLARNDQHVTVPFGLVALYWLKAFKPLLFPALREPAYPQQPSARSGLGFVKEGFRNLAQVSPHDFRVGSRFEGTDAGHLVRALRDVCHNIRAMPAKHTTFPESQERVFEVEYRSFRLSRDSPLTIDRQFLNAFGEFRVPTHVWDAMSRYACWIEPTILDKWCALMRKYESKHGAPRSVDRYRSALTWLEQGRDTVLVREVVRSIQDRGESVFCVWSGQRLKTTFQVDHCLPFAVWPNNDLWNLMPTTRTVNQKKSDRLPSAELLRRSGDRIADWWRRAYEPYGLFDRYRNEALSSLPHAAGMVSALAAGGGPIGSDLVFRAVLAGVDNQRLRLHADQQIAEWG